MSLTSYQAAPPRVLSRDYAASSAERNCKKTEDDLLSPRNRIESERVKGKAKSKILVGTASWSDPGFVEHWYPKKMPAGERLAWYAQHFEMVEGNSSFYSVPGPRLARRWGHSTPGGFVFGVKLHQLPSRRSK